MGTGYERPGRGLYVNATRVLDHGDLTVERHIPGSAIKQAAYSYDSARGVGRRQIDIGERFFLRTKGIAEAGTDVGQQGAAVSAAQVGDAIYIADGSGADVAGLLFAAAAAGRIALGRVHAIPGLHGTPPNVIRVDMDLKDTI